jgi:hypothetical protein
VKQHRSTTPQSLSGDKARRVVRDVAVFRHRLAASILAELKRLSTQQPTKQFQPAFSQEHQLLTSALDALRQPGPELPPTKESREYDYHARAVAEEDPLLWADVLGEK